MTSAAPHLPTVYLHRMAEAHPKCWRGVDEFRAMRGKDLPDWPAWCFLPLAGSYAIISRGKVLTPDAAGEIVAFGALAAWRATQGIYTIHPAVRAAIEDTPLDGSLPVDVLHRLPEWSVYLCTPGLRYAGMEAAGFFAFLEHDANTGRSELRLVVDCPPLLQGTVPIHLDCGGLELGVAAAKAEAERQAVGIPFMVALEALPSAEVLADALVPMVNLVLYLCAENAEIRDANGSNRQPVKPRPTEIRRGARLFAPEHPTTWEVGARLGAAIEAARERESEPAGGTHADPRPHIRRAHWHHYWIGPKEHQKLVLRWLSPIAVNVDDDHPTIPTVHEVGRLK